MPSLDGSAQNTPQQRLNDVAAGGWGIANPASGPVRRMRLDSSFGRGFSQVQTIGLRWSTNSK